MPHGPQAKSPEELMRIHSCSQKNTVLSIFNFVHYLSVIALDFLLVISHWLMIVTILHGP